MLYDNEAREIFKKSPNAVVAWWLMTSYLYYICNRSIISDALFDEMSKDMLHRYDSISHSHFYLITKEMLEAGSGYNLKDSDYPLMCKHAAWKIALDGVVK